MKRFIISALCLSLIFASAVSSASCSKKPGDADGTVVTDDSDAGSETQALLDTASGLCTSIRDVDLYEIEYLSDEAFYEIRGEWESRLNLSNSSSYDPSSVYVYNAIIDTIGFETDDSSAVINGSSASVNVTFTMVDWESVISAGNLTGNTALMDGLSAADTKEIPLNITFTDDNGVWLCSNTDDILKEIFSFLDEDFIYDSPVSDIVSGFSWRGDNCIDEYAGIYSHSLFIELHVYLTSYNAYDTDSFYCEISYNGEVRKIDQQGTTAQVFIQDIEESVDCELPAGTYTFTFYDADGNEIISLDAIVTADDQEVTYEDCHVWINADNTDRTGSNDHAPIYIAPEVIECEARSDMNVWNFSGYYTVEYEGNVIYTESGYIRACVSVSSGPDIPLDPSGTHLASGEYTITYYDEEGNQLCTDSCTVVEEGTFAVAEHLSWGFNEWDYDTDQPYFDNTSIMQCSLSYVGDLDESSVTATVYYNGEEIYSCEGTEVIISTVSNSDVQAVAAMGSYFDSGEYTFTFTDQSGNTISSETCYVINGNN